MIEKRCEMDFESYANRKLSFSEICNENYNELNK